MKGALQAVVLAAVILLGVQGVKRLTPWLEAEHPCFVTGFKAFYGVLDHGCR